MSKDNGLTDSKQRKRVAKTLRRAATLISAGRVNDGVQLMREAYGDIFFGGSRYGRKTR